MPMAKMPKRKARKAKPRPKKGLKKFLTKKMLMIAVPALAPGAGRRRRRRLFLLS